MIRAEKGFQANMIVSEKTRILLSLLLVILASNTFDFGSFASAENGEVRAVDVIVEQESKQIEYGVDVSYPMHHMKVSDNYEWLPHNKNPDNSSTPEKFASMPVQPLGDRHSFYYNLIRGCLEEYEDLGNQCLETEKERVDMGLRQPQSMKNFTETGYKKIRAPEELFKLILDFWEANKNRVEKEMWDAGNTYTNNWESPTYMVSVENASLRGGGHKLKDAIWNAARETISEWTGQELSEVSLYGVRVYKTNAVLATHVDRLPLVSSAIINVAQDVDEPWPLEVIGHDGKAKNITMVPGDMVLYESHSVLHGRPFPLKGNFLANIFVHFEPIGPSLRYHEPDSEDSNDEHRSDARNLKNDNENVESDLPPYILPGSPEAEIWRWENGKVQTEDEEKKDSDFSTGSTELHAFAQGGDLEAVQNHVSEQGVESINVKDNNGWTPLHEASREGHLEVIMFLVENGADVNMRTFHGKGETSLWLAKQEHGEDSPVVEFLQSVGATEIGPEL